LALLIPVLGLAMAHGAFAQHSPVALDITLPPVPPSSAQQYVAPPVLAPATALPSTAQPAPQPAQAAPQTRSATPQYLASQIPTSVALQRSWMADKPDYFKPFGFDWGDGKWFVSFYAGVAARSNLSSLLFRYDANYTRQYVVLGTLGREIGSLGNALRLEWETGLGVHFGHQTFVDAHLYFVARWIWFPWNRFLPTTIAIGTGPSFASARPDLENEKGLAGHYKNGLMLELTLAPPDSPDWMFAARIHHRSSLFGLLHNGSPSDYVTIGLKHRF
jgi:hypothetical protein